jgi:F-type H+-transporting ATPase subunit delta
MSADLTLARPYADAVFFLAQDSENFARWDEALKDLSLIQSEPCLQQWIAHPMNSHYASGELVKGVLAALNPEWLKCLDKPVDSLIALLLEENRFTLLPSIAQLFHQKWVSGENRKEAVVTGSYEWPEARKLAMREALNKRLGVQVDCHFQIDPAIKGGAIVAVDHWVLDGSVSTKLARLRESLQKVG